MFGDLMKKYPFCVAYCHDGDKYQVSLYSVDPKIDCGAMCKLFGGGGHLGAAGFWCRTLPWSKVEKETP